MDPCLLWGNISTTYPISVLTNDTNATRTTRAPAFWGYPPLPHEYPYYWVILDPKSKEDKVKVTNLKNLPKLQIYVFWNKHYMEHNFWSCLIRCANMKWIQWVLLKIQSRHMDKVKPVYPPSTSLSGGYNYIFYDSRNKFSMTKVKSWVS